MSEILKTDSMAPAFTLLSHENEKTSLKDAAGKWLILYFYPKDNTPGCTTEAIEFSAKRSDFEKLGCMIFGVSPDSPTCHQKFREGQNLTITLLSDPEHTMLEKYGVWQLKKNYGKEYMGVVRTTYIISPDGKIAHVYSPVKVEGHVDAVFAELKALSLK